MKAALFDKYGAPDVLYYKEDHGNPPNPKEGEVLIRVHATSVNPVDWKILSGDLKLFIKIPFPAASPGCDLAGVVEKVGPSVKRLKEGDKVIALIGYCGAAAEYVVAPESTAFLAPSNFSFSQSAGLPVAALTAFVGLKEECCVSEGQHVLVNGASGGVGVYAVQVAKALGAHVTGVCSDKNAEFVKSLGADEVIDYKTTDFTKQKDVKYDVVYDAVANKTLGECSDVLTPKGHYYTTLGGLGLMVRKLFNFATSRKAHSLMIGPGYANRLEALKVLCEEGKINTPIDKEFPLAEIKDAYEYSMTGRAKGKIILTV